ncbi:MAG: hypothetical protein ACTHLY_03960 [Pseudolabrys sp.]
MDARPLSAARDSTTISDLFLDVAAAQIADMQRALTAKDRAPADRERDARTLAALAKVLRELSACGANDNTGPDDDDQPRSLDSYRLELMRTMDELVARRKDQDASATE